MYIVYALSFVSWKLDFKRKLATKRYFGIILYLFTTSTLRTHVISYQIITRWILSGSLVIYIDELNNKHFAEYSIPKIIHLLSRHLQHINYFILIKGQIHTQNH